MIPHTTDTSTTSANANGKAFTIATNGKAFKILIDRLYSDKILAPVRELITNALDAHVAAGVADEPFLLTVPTREDPTFGVRDYGTGMDHETIMGLYTELFGSSKDGDNEQTGMLGLGSKSPFAYTDSFTVEAFDGVSKRTYSAYLVNDVPNISLVSDEFDDAPRGIRVSFHINLHLGEFRTAITKVVTGLDVVPDFTWAGDAVSVLESVPQDIRQGNGWKLVYDGERVFGYGQNGLMVRQGGVLYPAEPRREARNEVVGAGGDGYIWIIDAPIGSVDVTPSREALSYDEATMDAIDALIPPVWSEVQSQIVNEYAALSSQHEKYQWVLGLTRPLRESKWIKSLLPNAVMNCRYDLYPTHVMAKGWTQDEMTVAIENLHWFPKLIKKGAGERDIATHIRARLAPQNIMFVLEDGVSPRSRSRIIKWAGGAMNTRFRISVDGQQELVNRLKVLMNLDDSAFIKVADLPDEVPERAKRTPSGAPKAQALKVLRDELASGDKVWVEREGRKMIIRDMDGRCIEILPYASFDGPVGSNDLPATWKTDRQNILYLTPFQVGKLSPNYHSSLSAEILREAYRLLPETYGNMHTYTVRQELRQAGATHAPKLADHLMGHLTASSTTSASRVSRSLATYVVRNMEDPDIAALVDGARKRYPAVFPTPLADDEVEDYLAMMDDPEYTDDDV